MRVRDACQKTDVFLNQNHCENEKGQSVILVMLIIMSFMMFFTFCINTGLLINAKISVQAAADAAAYAGAATQARLLNSISYLNYDMRRQLKKLVFRNSFIAGMSSDQFPTPVNPGPFYDFPKLDYTNSAIPRRVPIRVPVVCVSVTQAGDRNENCTFINQRNSAFDVRRAMGVSAGSSNMSEITRALVDNMTAIANTQNQLCQAQSDANFFVALQWLFRGDTRDATLTQYLDALATHISDASLRSQIKDRVKGLVTGLGIYPRNIISMLRAETLRDFINTPPKTEMTKAEIESMESASAAEASERSILAFRSALSNLNPSIFNPERLVVDEIMPANAFSLTPITVGFNLFIQMMERNVAPPSPTNPRPRTCESNIFPFPAIDVPVGVKWDSNPGTELSYAVRVHAYVKPRGLLFMPGGSELELQAVAGAKPFGSRIGKNISNATGEFTDTIRPTSINGNFVITDPRVPNLVPNVDVGDSATMLSPLFLQELLQLATNGTNSYGAAGIARAERHAVAPNPPEVGVYNILPPMLRLSNGQPDLEKYKYEFLPFGGNGSSSGAGNIYRFYAPLYPAGGGGDPSTRMKAFIDQVFPSTSVGSNSFGIDMSSLGTQVLGTIQAYLNNELMNGTGENGESVPFAAIDLPMTDLVPPPVSGRLFWLTNARQVMSSWAPDYVRMSRGATSGTNPPPFGFQPRFGFSVKFVALRDLISKGLPDADDDLGSVTH